MSRYPRAARDAKIKCLQCNAPVTETVDGGYACVDCGRDPFGDGARSDAETSDGGGTALDDTPIGDDAALDETSVDDATLDDATLDDDSDSTLGIEQ